MITIPAIDLRGGKVVRLVRGNPSAATVYGDDPVAVAEGFHAAGARMIHVVDLDAALADGDNKGLIARICASVPAPVETGGGLRSMKAIAEVLEAGAARAVIGTSAALDAVLLDEAVGNFGEQIIVSLDVEGRMVMTHGWKEAAGPLEETLARLSNCGVARFMITQINVDGTMEGPDMDLYRLACELTDRPIIASGGVAGPEDLHALAKTGVEGAIVGTAIYEGTVNLSEVAQL